MFRKFLTHFETDISQSLDSEPIPSTGWVELKVWCCKSNVACKLLYYRVAESFLHGAGKRLEVSTKCFKWQNEAARRYLAETVPESHTHISVIESNFQPARQQSRKRQLWPQLMGTSLSTRSAFWSVIWRNKHWLSCLPPLALLAVCRSPRNGKLQTKIITLPVCGNG